VRRLAGTVEDKMRANPDLRLVNSDTGDTVPTAHLVLDQARLQQLGLTSQAIATQLQFQLSGVPVTQLREGQRVTEVVMRTGGAQRTAPDRLGDLSVLNAQGAAIPFAQVGQVEIRPETQILRRRDRVPTITLRADPAPGVQAAAVTADIEASLRDFVNRLPPGYRLEHGGVAEESDKSNLALAAVMPIMLLLMLVVIMIQVRSFRTMAMVVATAPLGLIGTGPALLLFNRPFGFTAILGLIGLAGILMRNTLILVAQIQANRAAGLDARASVIEATVQRARPVLLTALAAVLAFIPLATSSFWGAMALTLIGGTAAGTLVTLFALPAMVKLFDSEVAGVAAI
jgi:multidrug efflux pump subunit AcrB